MSDEQVIREFYDAYNENDIDRAVGLVTDDFRGRDLALGMPLEGPEGVRAWLEGFKRSMPDGWTEVQRLIVQGEWAATVHRGGGTNTGPLQTPMGELPPTGRTVELEIAEIFRLRDGKIAEMDVFYDAATMMRQLGLMPEPGQPAEAPA